MRKNQANWTIDSRGRVRLVIPNLYGTPKSLSKAEIMGRFTLDQIAALRASLPTVGVN